MSTGAAGQARGADGGPAGAPPPQHELSSSRRASGADAGAGAPEANPLSDGSKLGLRRQRQLDLLGSNHVGYSARELLAQRAVLFDPLWGLTFDQATADPWRYAVDHPVSRFSVFKVAPVLQAKAAELRSALRLPSSLPPPVAHFFGLPSGPPPPAYPQSTVPPS
eukprot:jgi/Tetstr1/433229/TSEL_022517.t1